MSPAAMMASSRFSARCTRGGQSQWASFFPRVLGCRGLYNIGVMYYRDSIWGLYRDSGKDNGDYYSKERRPAIRQRGLHEAHGEHQQHLYIYIYIRRYTRHIWFLHKFEEYALKKIPRGSFGMYLSLGIPKWALSPGAHYHSIRFSDAAKEFKLRYHNIGVSQN